MPTNKILFILFLIVISSCNEKTKEDLPEKKTSHETSNCSCGDLILDELYQHFYLNERTLPFTGICNENHKNGNLFRTKEFVEGKMDGEFIEYSDNNKLLKKWNFKKNKMHGDAFTYDTTGKLLFHGIYKNGILDSVVLSL